MTTDSLARPLALPCGAVLPNRIAKAAMTEGLADPRGVPTAELERLYGLWSDGGAGLLLSGNIQVDGEHLERPGNVIIEGNVTGEVVVTGSPADVVKCVDSHTGIYLNKYLQS